MLTVASLKDLLNLLPDHAEVVACTDDIEVVVDEETFYIRATSYITEDDNSEFVENLKEYSKIFG